jgi:hypothetical protein
MSRQENAQRCDATQSAEGHVAQPAALAHAFHPALPRPAASDGWIGTKELPGYRAGCVVAKLEDLPGVDAQHFYFDLLLLDARGRTQDTHSGPCRAMTHDHSLDDRSRFVRVVAELLRHAPDRTRGLAPLDPALAFIRDQGIDAGKLGVAAQLLDAACSEDAVVASLSDMLGLSLGTDEAHTVLCDVVRDFATSKAPHADVDGINAGGLTAQLAFLVHTLGKAKARSYLRKSTDFELLPNAAMLGL